MEYIYVNIILLLLIIFLVYMFNKKENYSTCVSNINLEENASNINSDIERNLSSQNPSMESQISDLLTLQRFESECEAYYNKQQEQANMETSKIQENQLALLLQQEKQIEHYVRLLKKIKEVYNKDVIAVNSCLLNNNKLINADKQAIELLQQNGLLGENNITINLKKNN